MTCRKSWPLPFKASFNGSEIFDALANVSGGFGEYNYLKSLEVNMAIALQMSIEKWGRKPVSERALLIASHNLPNWMKILETDAMMKENKNG